MQRLCAYAHNDHNFCIITHRVNMYRFVNVNIDYCGKRSECGFQRFSW